MLAACVVPVTGTGELQLNGSHCLQFSPELCYCKILLLPTETAVRYL